MSDERVAPGTNPPALGHPTDGPAIGGASNLGYGDPPLLVFSWAEQGVPAVPLDSERRGFGTALTTQARPYRRGAETGREFRPGGSRCAVDLLAGPAVAREPGGDSGP